jgi:predicted transcriptional regulator
MNILEEADKIVNKRSEEKERQYGSFDEGMEKASKLASIMTSKDITAIDMYKCMVALKISRESFNHKEDNLLDTVAYLGALNNYINNKNK